MALCPADSRSGQATLVEATRSSPWECNLTFFGYIQRSKPADVQVSVFAEIRARFYDDSVYLEGDYAKMILNF